MKRNKENNDVDVKRNREKKTMHSFWKYTFNRLKYDGHSHFINLMNLLILIDPRTLLALCTLNICFDDENYYGRINISMRTTRRQSHGIAQDIVKTCSPTRNNYM